jgi:hypothetical protein
MATSLPPPDVPAIQGQDPVLTQYLRTFALWAMRGLNDRLPLSEASPSFLLAARDNPSKIYKIEVDSSGVLHATIVPLGGGRP